MAQTKAASSKSKSSTKRSSTTKSRNGSGAQSTRSKGSRSTNRNARSTSQRRSQGSSKRSPSKSGGNGRSKLGTFADKAKAPAAAGGAALIGLAGGIALNNRNHKRKGVLARVPKPNMKMPKVKAPNISMPKPDSAARAVGDAAGKVADRSQRLGQVAAEIQKASEAISKRS